MLSVESDGRLIFTLHLPGARSVDVVGTFDGWHEQYYPMSQSRDGVWTLELHPPTGEHLFRYLIDGVYWVLDGTAHGTRTSATGQEMCRVWIPPRSQEPDALAA